MTPMGARFDPPPPPAEAAAPAADWARRLDGAAPREVIAAAAEGFAGRIAAVSSFGTESAVLLHMIAAVDRALPVIFLDTGMLFPETLAYRDELIARLGLVDVRSIVPDPAEKAAGDPDDALWSENPDACCALRKVIPLARTLAPFAAWINGRKRYQAATRSVIPMAEADGARIKFNPLADFTRADIEAYMAAHGLPHHPLEKFGFASIGCMPCTSRVKPGEDPRSGRWRGQAKTECGIHMPITPDIVL